MNAWLPQASDYYTNIQLSQELIILVYNFIETVFDVSSSIWVKKKEKKDRIALSAHIVSVLRNNLHGFSAGKRKKNRNSDDKSLCARCLSTMDYLHGFCARK